MREILVVNPVKKAASGKGQKMPKKKKRGKAPARRALPRRKNPRRAQKSVRRYGRRMISGLSVRSCLKDQIPIQLGMLAAQWATKRFGPIANEYDPATWSYMSYVKGGIGSFLAGMIANFIKPGMGQKVMCGGMSHVIHRLIRNEIIERSPWAIAQFGSDEEGLYIDETGTPYVASEGQYLPLDERHRQLPTSSIGETLVQPGHLGGQLEPVGPLGQSADYQRYAESYRE